MISRSRFLLLFAILSACFSPRKTVAQPKLLAFPTHSRRRSGVYIAVCSLDGAVAGGTARSIDLASCIRGDSRVFARRQVDRVCSQGNTTATKQVLLMLRRWRAENSSRFYPPRAAHARWVRQTRVWLVQRWPLRDLSSRAALYALAQSAALPRFCDGVRPRRALPMADSGGPVTFSPDGKEDGYSTRSRDFRTENDIQARQQAYILTWGATKTKKINRLRKCQSPIHGSETEYF